MAHVAPSGPGYPPFPGMSLRGSSGGPWLLKNKVKHYQMILIMLNYGSATND